MFIVLDALQDDDLANRRAAEAWMRCCLKSYLRIIDPILLILLDPAIMRQATSVQVSGVSVEVYHYLKPFDQAKVQHVLENLLSVARFGGQGFTRVAKGSVTRQTPDEALRKRMEAGNVLSILSCVAARNSQLH
jgi:hypothetical protein